MARSVAHLQQHHIEHSFEGCDDRGYACYICAAVFTAPAGLQLHMHELHGDGAKPYDCGRCARQFFFRTELQHHAVEHERTAAATEALPNGNNGVTRRTEETNGQQLNCGVVEEEADKEDDVCHDDSVDDARKHDDEVQAMEEGSCVEGDGDDGDGEEADEEYIEVEKLGEMVTSAADAARSPGAESSDEGRDEVEGTEEAEEDEADMKEDDAMSNAEE